MRELPFSLHKEQRANAILGLQTQHRKPMKPQPLGKPNEIKLYGSIPKWRARYGRQIATGPDYEFKSRYQVGDKLWLQEPYQIEMSHDETHEVQGLYADDDINFMAALTSQEWLNFYARKFPYRGTSGRFMYKSLARHWFEVEGVRAERVQHISEEDAQAEGCDCDYEAGKGYRWYFRILWDSIYGGTEFAWAKNPWDFVYKFRKVDYGR